MKVVRPLHPSGPPWTAIPTASFGSCPCCVSPD